MTKPPRTWKELNRRIVETNRRIVETNKELKANLLWLRSEEGQRAIAIFRKAIQESKNSNDQQQ